MLHDGAKGMCSKNKKMRTLPQKILRSCNHAIMQSCNLEQDINMCILQSSALIATNNKPEQQSEKTHLQKHQRNPKLDLFRRSHVDDLAVLQSDPMRYITNHLHHLNHLQSSNKPEQQSEENTLTNRLKKSQNSFFFEDRT